MTTNSSRRSGFTLIELMLAMTFLSILLLAIAMLTIQISNIYTRGVTLREVNAAGGEISNDLQRAIQGAQVFDLGETAEGGNFVQFDNGEGEAITGGRLCLGKYSYAWNYGKTLIGPSGDVKSKYKGSGLPVRFAKVIDSGRVLCSAVDGVYPDIPQEGAVDMLANSGRNISVQEFSISSNDGGLYSIAIEIGTNERGALVDDGESCRPPSDLASDFNYCAVNRFDIVAKAGSI